MPSSATNAAGISLLDVTAAEEDAINHGKISPDIASGLLALQKRIRAAGIPRAE